MPRRTQMPSKIGQAPMVRKNYFFHALQVTRLTKIANLEGGSVASLLREGADRVIADRVEKIKAKKDAEANVE